MASTFLDEKISSFIEDKFPEFVKDDHPVFVEFLREYYKFLEAAKLTLTSVQATDQILLENKLTTNYLANEFDGSRFVFEDSVYGPFQKDETVTGQTSGATATVLAEDNANDILYIEANRHFQVGEIIVGSISKASATIGKYQGNPVQTIQQLLEYVDVDSTINDYLDQFREAYLTAVPNTLATGVSKRKLIKSVRDLYRAKGTKRGHEAFFRLMFNETPELTYPTENILKVSAGDWSSDTVLRIVATENNPANLIGQTVSQTVNVGLDHGAASANVEAVLQLQEGETTVYQLILNVASISGTFVAGAEVTGIDSTDADTSIAGTVQPILIGASVTNGASGYTTDDTVTVTSSSGQNATINIVDVGSGEIGQIVIDNPGSGYTVGDPLYFDNTNTEGAGASAIVSCVDGAIGPELGDSNAHTVTGNTSSGGPTITNITTSTLYGDFQFDIKGKVTTGSTSIKDINTANLVVGASISGTGIPANTTITSIDTVGVKGVITISNVATHGGTTGSISSITRAEEGALDFQIILEDATDTGENYLLLEDGEFVLGEGYLTDTATVTTSSAHGLSSEDTVTITGATPNDYNGIKNIRIVSPTQFSYSIVASADATAGGTKTFTVDTKNRSLTHLEEGTGQKITGSGIPTGTTIRSIDTVGASNNGTITISNNATATASGVTLTIPSEYGMETFDHIVYEDSTEITDAYTGNQIQIESGTLASLSATDEAGEVFNVTVFSPGSGYEVMPKIKPATHRLTFNASALTTSGKFIAGETITNNASPSVSATITTSLIGKVTIAERTGAFATDQIITGSTSGAKATLTAVTALGANATFLGWSTTGIGSISGVEVSNFGTGFSTAPTATVPVKMLLTRNTNVSSPPDITLATAFSSGDTIIGQTSSARGTVTAWDNARQVLTVRTTLGTFQRSEILTRGSGTNYAILSEIAQGTLSTSIGTIGTTAGAFNNDKGKISESLMRIQDSYYYQDFSYVVKVGAAIADWRAEIKKSVHPAGFAMFGEVSISNKVATLMTVPVTGITTETPALASLFEAVLTTVVGRRLGTTSDGTTLLGETEIKGTSEYDWGTLKRGSHLGHEPQLFSTIESITRSGTTATVETTGPHGIQAGEQVEISGVTTTGYDGVYEVSSAFTSTTFTATGNTTKDSKTVTNITTTSINEGALLGVTGSGIPADLTRFDSITSAGNSNNGTITLSHAATATASGVTLTFTVVSQESFKITVTGSPSSPATVGGGKVKLVSPFDNSTRDVTLRPLTEVTVYPLYGDWASVQRNRYGLGPRQSNAIKYMWAAPPTEFTAADTSESHQTVLETQDVTGINDHLLLEPEALARFDYDVTVAGGKFVLKTDADVSGVSQRAITLDGQRLYRFDLSHSTLSGKTFKISETTDGTHTTGGNEWDMESPYPQDFNIELETGSYIDHTVTGNTTSGSNTITNITTTLLGVGNKFSGADTYDGIPLGATIASIVTEGSSNNGTITISTNATVTKTGTTFTISEYGLGDPNSVGGIHKLIAEDDEGLTMEIYERYTTHGTPGSAGAYVELFTENVNEFLYYYGNTSGMGGTITLKERSGDFLIFDEGNAGYSPGSSAITNMLLEDGGYILYETDTDPEDESRMVSEDSTIVEGTYVEDHPNRMEGQMGYAYPNIIRRESPEVGTDNVDAGGAGVYDTTMNYTNIKIWDHESNVHNRISDFRDVRIVDIIKCGREFLEIGNQTNKHEGDNDYEFTLMEDGSHIQMESGSAGIPTTSRKIWNVPPPSYIRLTTS